LPLAQPISFTDGRKPPALLLTGDVDEVFDPATSARFAEKLQSRESDTVGGRSIDAEWRTAPSGDRD